MQDFGFEAVPLYQAAGRIAACLTDITTALDKAVGHGDLGAIANGVAELGRVRLALDAWEASHTKVNRPCWLSSLPDGPPIKVHGRGAAVCALLDLFPQVEVPDDFRFHGQTWDERAEAWVMHAEEQLESELEHFKDCGSDPCGDDEDDDKDEET